MCHYATPRGAGGTQQLTSTAEPKTLRSCIAISLSYHKAFRR